MTTRIDFIRYENDDRVIVYVESDEPISGKAANDPNAINHSLSRYTQQWPTLKEQMISAGVFPRETGDAIGEELYSSPESRSRIETDVPIDTIRGLING